MMEKLRIRCIKGVSTRGRPAGGPAKLARQYSGRAAHQPEKFLRIQGVMANHAAIEQEHRHLEAIATRQLRIGVDVDDGNRGQTLVALEVCEPMEHLLAQPAALAADHHEARRERAHRTGLTCGAAPGEPGRDPAWRRAASTPTWPSPGWR